MYLDPGSGSVILQLILATLLGAGVAVRVFWSRIKNIFSKKQPLNDETGNEIDDGRDPQP
jgi:hypothetical protein